MTIAFDVDGTILDLDGHYRDNIVELLIAFQNVGFDVYIHSGGGKDYAQLMANRLTKDRNLEKVPTAVAKGDRYNIAVDDIMYVHCDFLIKL